MQDRRQPLIQPQTQVETTVHVTLILFGDELRLIDLTLIELAYQFIEADGEIELADWEHEEEEENATYLVQDLGEPAKIGRFDENWADPASVLSPNIVQLKTPQ